VQTSRSTKPSGGSAFSQILHAAGFRALESAAFAAYSPLVIFSYALGPVLIISSHVGSLLVFAVGLTWGGLLWLVSLYLIRMLATTAIYHRLLTHKSYRAPAIFLWLGCIVAASAGQMGPSWWKAHHVMHHKYSDQALDPHSPVVPNSGIKGFISSQAGWQIPHNFPERLPADVENDLVLRTIDRFHFIPPIALGIISYQIGGLSFLAAFFLSTTILYHGVATVNSLSHIWGEQPFQTADNSRNNLLVSILTLGEGWHNLHHAIPSSCRHGYTIKQGLVVRLLDPTFSFIKLLESLNIASRLRLPTHQDLLEYQRIPNASGRESTRSPVPTLTP
jgi:stearoyl-CoA desaturase (delta-9 desaturase)